MSIKTTVELTRKQAIKLIVEKQIKLSKKEMEYSLNYLTNKELEELLDDRYYDSIFENYLIVEESKGE